MPLLTRRRVIAAKIEAVPGVAETLAGADGVFNASNIQIQPTIAFNERTGQGTFSPLPGQTGPRGGTCTFDIEVATNGAAGTPAWASTFLAGCGMVNISSTIFAPRSLPPGGSGFPKTLTIGVYADGVRKSIRGAMGNAVIRAINGQKIMISFTFTGIWVTPTDAAMLTPTYPSVRPIRMMDASMTVGAVALPPAQEFTLDLGNDVQLREDFASAQGYAHAVIVNRRITGTVNPEETLVATRDEYGLLIADTVSAFLLGVGPANNAILVRMPSWQRTNVQETDRNGVQAHQITYQANRSTAGGDDDLEIEFTG